MSAPKLPCYRVRRSGIHGVGVFATRRIRAGTRIIEYTGERVTHAEADRRYADRPASDNHTFLFSVDAGTVIDGGSAGNAARYINHSCAPNCTSTLVGGRIYIRALRTIQSGEELHYDYRIERARSDPPDVDRIYACRCVMPACRGTMLRARRTRAARAGRQQVATAAHHPPSRAPRQRRARA
jgi:uncharacterized protein